MEKLALSSLGKNWRLIFRLTAKFLELNNLLSLVVLNYNENGARERERERRKSAQLAEREKKECAASRERDVRCRQPCMQ
jgi:hypothetical protein